MTRAVMASSVACARCHDHKFDPFLMQDYYALAGVFTSTKAYFGTAVSPSNRIAGDPLILPRGAGQPIFHASIPQERVASLKAQLAALRQEQEVGMAAAMNAFRNGEDTEETQIAATFFAQGRRLAEETDISARQLLANYCQALLATAEFRNVD